MNGIALSFLLVNAAALLFLPRRLAPAPLIAGACYMTLGQGFEIGPLTFTVIRILVAVGVVRVAIRAERISGGLHALDWLIMLWATWAVASSVFHDSGALVNRLGLVYNCCGIYFLLRVFCSSREDIILLCRIAAVVLVPVALEMLQEKRTNHNIFTILGGVPEAPEIREGRIRANGPFAHAILAGTVGAVNLPLMVALWRSHRKTAFVGSAACLTMVLCSASSGPALSAIFSIAAVLLWRGRHWMRAIRWGMVFAYLALAIVMKAPVYYLLARIDIAGGGTGWYRSRLIESSIEHIDEWWFAGTDYTRHWMVTGVAWSGNHVDITNYYLSMGVLGGLPLMGLFIAIISVAFVYVGQTIRRLEYSAGDGFVVWSLGASLFAHAATSFSVTYFDQSFVFFYLVPAALASLRFSSEPPSESVPLAQTQATRSVILLRARTPLPRRGAVRPIAPGNRGLTTGK